MVKKIDSNKARLKSHGRVRNKVNGTAERPRLSAFLTPKNLDAQLIHDTAGGTHVHASLPDKAVTY